MISSHESEFDASKCIEDAEDFLDEVLLLRGSNTATVKAPLAFSFAFRSSQDLTVLKNQIFQTLPPLLKRRLRL